MNSDASDMSFYKKGFCLVAFIMHCAICVSHHPYIESPYLLLYQPSDAKDYVIIIMSLIAIIIMSWQFGVMGINFILCLCSWIL